jgi:hypothetical protein
LIEAEKKEINPKDGAEVISARLDHNRAVDKIVSLFRGGEK